MSKWPKLISIKGIEIPVASWDEMDEVIKRYGNGAAAARTQRQSTAQDEPPPSGDALAASDHTLLEQFVSAGQRGVPTTSIGSVLGRRGKGIRGELESWSRRIGLVNQQGASAFEPVKGARGRGFRLVGIYLQAAQKIIGVSA